MRKIQSLFSSICVAVLLAVTLAACGDNTSTPSVASSTTAAAGSTTVPGTTAAAGSTTAAAGSTTVAAGIPGPKPDKITIAVQAGAPEVAVYKVLSKTWEQQTGIKIEWVEIPQDSEHDKLVTELSSHSGSYDALGLDQPWIAEFAAANYIDPLDDRISPQDKSDFSPNEISMESYLGKLYGLPHYMFAPVMYYRPDLFDKNGLRKPTLEQPLTKDEFLADAQKLTSGDVFGTIVEAKRHVVPVTHMVEYIYREGGVIIDANRKAHVNSPEAITGVQFLVDLVNKYKVAPPGALGFDNVDNHTLFSQGKLGMAINWPYAYSLINDSQQSTVSNNFAVTLPFKAVKSTSAVGGWGVALARDSKKKEAAWDWMKFITSTDQLYNLRKKSFGPPARQSELAKLQADPTVTQVQRDALAVMLKAVDNGTLIPGIPEWNQVSDVLNIALQDAVGGKKSVKDALDGAQADIEKILK